jgi:hypothetical protein
MNRYYQVKIFPSIFFIPFLFTSCTSNTVENLCNSDHEVKEAETVRDIKIDVEGKQYSHEIAQTSYFSNVDWYFGLDNSRNCIDVIDLTNEKFQKSLIIKNDGSEGSIDVSDFYFHNRASIILFSEQGEIQIRNIEDSLINEISLRTETILEWSKEDLTAGIGDSQANIFFDPHKNYLYIPNVPPVYYSDDNYYSAPTILAFDLNKEEFINYGTLVPDDIKNHKLTPTTRNDWYTIVNSFDDGDILVSYFDSQFYSKGKLNNEDSLKMICRSSHFYSQEIPPIDMNDFNMEREYVIKKGIYVEGFFHPKYESYVNSVRHNQEFKNADGKVNNPFHADFSILILDENFNALEEFKIPTGKYNFNKVYPHSEGVLIMKENPNNENNEEDLLEFSVFAID